MKRLIGSCLHQSPLHFTPFPAVRLLHALAVSWPRRRRALVHPVRVRSPLPFPAMPCPSLSPVLPLQYDWTITMVRTHGGSRYRPRVRFSTPEMEDPDTSEAAGAYSPVLPAVTQPALAPTAIPEERQRFRRYQTRMGPRAPSPVPQRRRRRAQPSKRARTSGPGESSRSRPEPSPPPPPPPPQLRRAHRPSYHRQ